MALTGDHRITIGGDYRFVDGETDEDFRWNGVRFTRLRTAGGSQSFVGAFVEDAWTPVSSLTIVRALRFDHWELFDGSRRESDILTGAVSLDSAFPDREGDEVSARVGTRFEVT